MNIEFKKSKNGRLLTTSCNKLKIPHKMSGRYLIKALSLISLIFIGPTFAAEFSNFTVSVDRNSSYYNQISSVRFKYDCMMHGPADEWHLAEIKGNNLFGLDLNLNCKSQPGGNNHLLKQIEVKLTLNNLNEGFLTVKGSGGHFGFHDMKNGEQIDCNIRNTDQLSCPVINK